MSAVLAGRVLYQGPGGPAPAEGVAVSNGRAVTRTGADGAYDLPAEGAERFVFVTVPSGWQAAGAWYHDRARNPNGPYDFALAPAPERATQPFSFAHISDLHVSAGGWDELPRLFQDQVATYDERGKLVSLPLTRPEELAADLDAIHAAEAVDFIIATGDVTNGGAAAEFAAYAEAIAAAPAPVVTMPGNHDYMDDAAGPNHYRDAFGPSYFSFEWGGVHFLAWDWEGMLRWGATYAQHAWVSQDLATLPADMPVIVLTHNVLSGAFYDRFPSTRFLASFSGHWHTSRVFDDGRLLHVNTPSLCFGGGDYSPRAYRHVRVENDRVHVSTRTITDTPALASVTFRPLDLGRAGDGDGAAAPVALGEPWPTFGGDVRRTGCASAAPELPLALAWRRPTGGALHLSSPVVADGLAIIGTQREDESGGSVVAFDAATGEEIWSSWFGASIKHTPAVADGLVVAISVTGELAALDLHTGERRWSAQVGDPHFVWHYRPPLVADGRVYAGDQTAFGAFDLATGAPVWERTDFNGPEEPPNFSITSAPAWTAQGVVIGVLYEKQHLYCLDPETGATRWVVGTDRDPSIVAGPAVAADGTLVVTRLYAQAHALTPTGEPRWTHPIDSLFSPAAPAVNGEAAFVATGAGTVYRFDLATGEVAWTWQCDPAPVATASYVRAGRSLVSSPAIAGEALFVGAGDGRFRALDIATGAVAWEADLGAPVHSSPAVSGNAVYVGAADGTLACFTPAR